MRLSSDYNNLGLPVWSVLHVAEIDGESVTCQRSLTANREHDGELVAVPLSFLRPPCGWQDRYIIHCQPDKVAEVMQWLSRGITVRQSQYVGDGSTAFQPTDNSEQPHWRFGEVTDIISPEMTKDCIRIVKLESIADASLPAPCQYCNGTGIHTTNESLERQSATVNNCPKCGVHAGFSFTEPWHFTSSITEDNFCAEVRRPGECWCCNGTGKGARYLSEMEPRKERKAAIATLEAQGWKVWYQKRGQLWRMERETIVKDFGQ